MSLFNFIFYILKHPNFMTLLFHPKVLNLLIKFKKTGKQKLLNSILSIILDNTETIDISYVKHALFSHTGIELENSIENTIIQNFIKKKVNNSYVCFTKNEIAVKYAALMNLNRKRKPCGVGDSLQPNFIDFLIEDENFNIKSGSLKLEIDNSQNRNFNFGSPDPKKYKKETIQANTNKKEIIDSNTIKRDIIESNTLKKESIYANTNKKEISQANTLNFIKVQSIKPEVIEKFAPLALKNATFIYDRNNIVYDTQRRRDDLINPVHLQFIKYYDQCKPPIYRKRGVLSRRVFSDRKIPEVLSYDEESSEDWENIDEEQTDSTSSEESEEPGDEDWVEKDSEEVEFSRCNKKPCFVFQPVPIETYFEENAFANANLVESDVFNEDLARDFEKFEKSCKFGFEEMIGKFSILYNVNQSVILKRFK